MNTKVSEMTEHEIEESLIDLMDECYETVQVAGMTFTAATILKNCDETAWRIMLGEHEDYLLEREKEEEDE